RRTRGAASKAVGFRTNRFSLVQLTTEGAAQSLKRGREFLGLNSRFAYRGHEVRVADPARQNVQVQMSGDTGSRGLSDIYPFVESIGVIEILERAFHPSRERHHLRKSFGFGIGERRPMGVGNHHDVP